MHAHIAVGNVAGAAANFVDERARADFDSDASADGGAAGGIGSRGH